MYLGALLPRLGNKYGVQTVTQKVIDKLVCMRYYVVRVKHK